ncbi:MarR family winged helix-turn-helix transcriptional regulator [Actinokineospora sp. PR83]|uniref:MarR family winged helix-turn-helix transcriptional regulator n=1 Tax=Actinokineospora sp. PR83 TaxID=2884908 RepID=UPI0027E092A8|nr:MarR family winged helix-turn-helix transcriptional regulator [Actinokineospora sp. PR83]MCG8916935.1 MarR family winged helix-turn-helix transcriptional regulator [Actinokineospora sp. PR83]
MDEPLLKPEVDPPARVWRLTSWLLHHVNARSNRVVAGHFGRPGWRMWYAILAGLDQYGNLSQAELCRRLGIDRGDAVSILNDLEGEGLARRLPDSTDSRRKVVNITAAGREMLFKLDAVVEAAQDDLLRTLTPEERGQLNALLRKLIERPGADSARTARHES